MSLGYRFLSLFALTLFVWLPSAATAQTLTADRVSTTLAGPPVCTVETCIDLVVTGSNANDLCLINVIDASSSMVDPATEDPPGVNRWDRTLDALINIVNAVGDNTNDVFGLVTFGTAASIQVQPAISDTNAFNNIVRGLTPPPSTGEQTFTEAALDSVLTFSCPVNATKVVLLSSDGIPTVFSLPNPTPPPPEIPIFCDENATADNQCTEAAEDAAEVVKSNDINIITVGLGLDSLDATDALGIATLDTISSGLAFNIPSPDDAQPVIDALIALLGGLAIGNVVVDDTLATCWDFDLGSTTGDLGTGDPTVGSGFVTYDVGTMVSGETISFCYDMVYDVPTCGNVGTPIDFNDGVATYNNTQTIGLTDDVPGSGPVDMSACLTTLPVELVEFTARTDERSVVLDWSTASEFNNSGFEVEHAVGDGFFEVAGFVEGGGSTSDAQEYSFTISELEPGTHQFRLKQVDFDGAFEYSEVLEAAVEVPEAYHLGEIYPNPFNPEASMRFWVTRSQRVEVTLHDVQGRQLMRLYDGAPAAKASTLVRIDGSSLASGTYLVKVTGEDFSESRQVTLLK